VYTQHTLQVRPYLNPNFALLNYVLRAKVDTDFGVAAAIVHEYSKVHLPRSKTYTHITGV
jgi:hypothetical protein